MKIRFNAAGNETTATVEVRTKAGDLLECSSKPAKSYQTKGATLREMADVLLENYGMRCYTSHGDSAPFPEIVKDEMQTDADFIIGLAQQAGFLVSSHWDGNLMLLRAAVDEKPIGTLKFGQYPVLTADSSFDMGKTFSHTFAFSEGGGDNYADPMWKTISDPSVKAFRPHSFNADGCMTSEALLNAIRWNMNSSLADACRLNVSLTGWYDGLGYLWHENQMLSFFHPGAFILQKSGFIIQSVELVRDERGDVTNLVLVLPEAYTVKPRIGEHKFPWSGFYDPIHDGPTDRKHGPID